MRYLCLIYEDQTEANALTPSAYEALVAETRAYVEEIRQSGHFIASAALQDLHTATSIRFGHGAPTITDGPFIDSRTQLGGFILIEARDLNEAIRLASQMPAARMGGVEVRPVLDVPTC